MPHEPGSSRCASVGGTIGCDAPIGECGPPCVGAFAARTDDRIAATRLLIAHLNPAAMRVVYAIGTNKATSLLEAAFPFLSRVNLCAHVERIRSMGFGVECAVVGHQSGGPVARRRRARGQP